MPSSPDPSASPISIHSLEIAHVLFMDIVAYSQLPMDEQTRLIELLQQIVRNTAEFSQAQKRRQLLRLPTGDGMALVFFGDAEAPARCALEIGKALSNHHDLNLRMGIHTGPVHRLADINANKNVAGGGINLAQRVMDCGDAGHILISKSVADVLGQMSNWKPMLHDLGEVQVKHGVVVPIYNLYTEDAGNRELPQKLQASRQATIRARRKKVSLVATSAVVVAMATGEWFYLRQPRKLTDKDTVVLADFENRTGDSIFDDSLKEAMAVDLEQSPFLSVVSDKKISDTLHMMGRAASERLTMALGRELCQRTGSKAVLGGRISGLGSHYVIELDAIASATGDNLAREQGEAGSKEDVLKTVSRACSSLRRKLGESLTSVQKFDIPIEATTSSLEALKNVGMSISVGRKQGDRASIPFLKRAIDLDPNFPMAYNLLAVRYGNLLENSLALEYATKAYQLRDRVNERERLAISGTYFAVRGELGKQIDTYEMSLSEYPRTFRPQHDLGTAYLTMGQCDKAAAAYETALQLLPGNVSSYQDLEAAYIAQNRLNDAKATFAQAQARGLDSAALRLNNYYLAFLQRDGAEMAEQVAWAAGKPGDEDSLLSAQSDTEAYYGHVRKARDLSRRAMDSAVRADSTETAASWQVNSALREAELGNLSLARQGAEAALKLSRGRDVKVAAALALARTGDGSRTTALMKELEKDYATHSLMKFYWLPTIGAALQIKANNSSQAVSLLEVATPYELSATGTFINNLYPAYVRGQAFLLAHNGNAAAAEFQKLLDRRGIVVNFVTGALVHLQLGRAYAMAGDTAKAKAAYQDFLNLWKDADPDIPALKQAETEYAKLQ